MSFQEVQLQIIKYLFDKDALWDEIVRHMNQLDTMPAVTTLALLKLERDLIVNRVDFKYSLFLYSGEMI